MVFSSPVFLFLFLPCLFILYDVLVRWGTRSWQNGLLLFASLLFYSWGEGPFVLIMLASIVVNYGFGRWIDAAVSGKAGVLALAIASNLGLLAWFKYANQLFGLVGLPSPEVHLPIGISFFTFQAISYVVDVYRGTVAVQRNPVRLALYISLFPQLIAGPIIRYHDVARQLAKRQSTWPGVYVGAKRFILGLGKKVLIANPLGEVASEIFAAGPAELDPGAAWLGALCFMAQIYFDFSGYSDMAIGLGRIFGFRFLENFNFPYISRSIQEFWRRWHISLSSWFRDYLYIPLGGNRKGPVRTYINLVLVFLLCGWWHGASGAFVLWGAYHGFFLVLERVVKLPFRIPGWLGWPYAFAVVLVGWVLFNSPTATSAIDYLGVWVGGGDAEPRYFAYYWLDTERLLILFAACLGAIPWYDFVVKRLCNAGPWLEGIFLLAVLVIAMSFLAVDTYNPFLYFRF